MYNALIMFILYCETLLLLLRWDTGKFRDSLVVWIGLRVGSSVRDGSTV